MEEDIKILENLKENVALFSGGWQPILKQEEKQAIENLINRNKELEEKVKHLHWKNGVYIDTIFEGGYIKISKIKEKIEEKTSRIKYLNNELEKAYKELEEKGTETEIDMLETYIYNMETENTMRHSERKALEELLEE